MMDSKSGSGVRPRLAARSARNRAGQLRMTAAVAGSGIHSIKAAAAGDTRSSAATMSATVTLKAGMLTALRPPQVAAADPAAHSRAPIALAGEASATLVAGSTGETAR